jgi:hypothetical protein
MHILAGIQGDGEMGGQLVYQLFIEGVIYKHLHTGRLKHLVLFIFLMLHFGSY